MNKTSITFLRYQRSFQQKSKETASLVDYAHLKILILKEYMNEMQQLRQKRRPTNNRGKKRK
jgi:hypothetical protein